MFLPIVSATIIFNMALAFHLWSIQEGTSSSLPKARRKHYCFAVIQITSVILQQHLEETDSEDLSSRTKLVAVATELDVMASNQFHSRLT